MKYMDLFRNRAIIQTYYYTVVLLVKRNTLISYLYFLSDVYVLIIYECGQLPKPWVSDFGTNLFKAVH